MAYSRSQYVCCHPRYWKLPGWNRNLFQMICFYFIESSFPHKFAGTADLCDASVWHVGDIVGEESEVQTIFHASSYYPHPICWWVVDALLLFGRVMTKLHQPIFMFLFIFLDCSFYYVRRYTDPFLRQSPWILGRIGFCPNNILCKE